MDGDGEEGCRREALQGGYASDAGGNVAARVRKRNKALGLRIKNAGDAARRLGGLVVGEDDEFAGDRIVAHDSPAVRRETVAAVRYDGRWLILGNRNLETRQDIDIAEFEPLFVIDREGVKRMTAPAPPDLMVSASPTAGDLLFLSGWQTMPLFPVTLSATAASGDNS